jgi:hypothetical protein
MLKIFQHLRPEAYFAKEKTGTISTDFLSDIEARLGGELTPEEKIALGMTVEEYDDSDVDIIERA